MARNQRFRCILVLVDFQFFKERIIKKDFFFFLHQTEILLKDKHSKNTDPVFNTKYEARQ